MEIETKHILALIFLVGFGSVGLFGTLISQRLRDLALFAFVVGAPLLEKMNVTFLGHYWYRGTSRGIEIAAIDLIPLCLIIATLLLPRYERGRFFWPASLGLMFLYLGYCAVSVWHAEPQLYGVWELSKIVRGIIVFVGAALFIRTRRELAIVVVALVCTSFLEGLNGLEQRYFKGAFRVPGTFDHENTLSTYLCTIGPVLVAAAMANWSRWLRWAAGLGWVMAAGAELLTLSRLGVPVFALVSIGTAVACMSWKLTRQKVLIAGLAFAIVGSFVVFSWDGLKARYAQGNIRMELTEAKGFETRGVYWRIASEMIKDFPYGVGLNNWSYFVGKTYGPAMGYSYTDYDDIKWVPTKDDVRQTLLPPAADTLPALTLGELGVAGLAVFLLLWLRWLQMGATFLHQRLNENPMHRLGLGFLFGTVGIFLQSATEWTYRQTPVMFTFHVMMGALASLYLTRRRALRLAAERAREVEADDREANDIEIEVEPVPVARAAAR